VIREITTQESRAKASDKFADAGGLFCFGGGIAGTAAGYGEPHTAESEEERRAIKLFAEDQRIGAKRGLKKWHTALDKSINNQVLAILSPEVKARLGRNLNANLTKTDKARIMDHFSWSASSLCREDPVPRRHVLMQSRSCMVIHGKRTHNGAAGDYHLCYRADLQDQLMCSLSLHANWLPTQRGGKPGTFSTVVPRMVLVQTIGNVQQPV
jgi:hypothetical protein